MPIFKFGANKSYKFLFDTRDTYKSALKLINSGKAVPLQPLTFQLLQILIRERKDHTKTNREDLLKIVWRGRKNEGSNYTLEALINKLRDSLGDKPKQPTYIKTIRGEGYQFIADVEEISPSQYKALLHKSDNDFSGFFDNELYYELSTRSFPYLEPMLQELKKYIPNVGDPIKVLVLGCGTGSSTKIVLEECKDSTVTAIEDREILLKEAMKRLESFGSRVKFQPDHIKNARFENGYHLCVSVLAIHHLTTKEKISLFSRVYKCLMNEGRFLIIDRVKFRDKRLQTISNADEEGRIAKLPIGQEWMLNTLIHRVNYDKPETVEDMLKWLAAAGFSSAECMFRHYSMAMIYAEKTAPL